MYQYEFIVNGYPVHAQYSEQFINDIAMPLLETWSRMANDKQVLVFLAAPPGVGKSTMALLFETLAVRKGVKLQALGMDGFHHYQKYILSHTVFIDGTEIEMKKVKGCPESFVLFNGSKTKKKYFGRCMTAACMMLLMIRSMSARRLY